MIGRKFSLSIPLALAALLVLALGGRVADTWAAAAWVRHLAHKPPAVVTTRQLVRHALVALDRGAPLPVAAEAAGLSVQAVRALLPKHPQPALELANQLRARVETLQSAGRGAGLWGVGASARLLEVEARGVALTQADAGARPRR